MFFWRWKIPAELKNTSEQFANFGSSELFVFEASAALNVFFRFPSLECDVTQIFTIFGHIWCSEISCRCVRASSLNCMEGTKKFSDIFEDFFFGYFEDISSMEKLLLKFCNVYREFNDVIVWNRIPNDKFIFLRQFINQIHAWDIK